MTNKYSSKCVRCGKTVPARSGAVFKLMGKFKTIHSECKKEMDDIVKATTSKTWG